MGEDNIRDNEKRGRKLWSEGKREAGWKETRAEDIRENSEGNIEEDCYGKENGLKGNTMADVQANR